MTITQDISAPLFVIVGSTGTQGTSVINAIREDDTVEYRVRALARNPSSDHAKERSAWGCEVLAADLDGSVDDLAKAFGGAKIVFAMTTPAYGPGVSDPFTKEFGQGKLQVDAARAAGVKTLVWSGLPSLTKISGGKYPCAHFDAKAEVTTYARTLEDLNFTVYEVSSGRYASNYTHMLAPQKQPDGTYVLLHIVDNPKDGPVIDTEADYGRFVLAALKHRTLKTVLAASEYLSLEQTEAALMKVSGGKTVKHIHVPTETVHGLVKAQMDESAANNFVNMIRGCGEFGFWGDADIAPSKALLSQPARTLEEALLARQETFDRIFA